MSQEYGILKSVTNTGSNEELLAVFAAPLSIINNKPNFSTETLTLKRRVTRSDAQRWDIQAGLMPKSDATDFFVHNVVNGYTEDFFVRMPQIYRNSVIPQETAFDAYANASPGDDYVYLSSTQLMPVGEFIRFTGHTKVYLVVESTVQALNVNKVRVYPSLFKAVLENDVVKHGAQVNLVAQYGSDTQLGVSYVDGILARVDAISLVERL